MTRTATFLIALICVLPARALSDEPRQGNSPAAAALIRSARSGAWSEPQTWEGGQIPGAGAKVQVRAGHTVTYDTASDQAVRSIHVAGTLRFDPQRDTRLDVGLIKIQAGDDASENGFDCDAHAPTIAPESPRPGLEIGTAARPISAGHSAVIRKCPVKRPRDGRTEETVVAGIDPQHRSRCRLAKAAGSRYAHNGALRPSTYSTSVFRM